MFCFSARFQGLTIVLANESTFVLPTNTQEKRKSLKHSLTKQVQLQRENNILCTTRAKMMERRPIINREGAPMQSSYTVANVMNAALSNVDPCGFVFARVRPGQMG